MIGQYVYNIEQMQSNEDDGIVQIKMQVTYRKIQVLRFVEVTNREEGFQIRLDSKLQGEPECKRVIRRTKAQLEWLLQGVSSTAMHLAVLPLFQGQSYFDICSQALLCKRGEENMISDVKYNQYSILRMLKLLSTVCLPFLNNPREQFFHPLFLFISDRFTLYVHAAFTPPQPKSTWVGLIQNTFNAYFSKAAEETKQLEEIQKEITLLSEPIVKFMQTFEKYLEGLKVMGKEFLEGKNKIKDKYARNWAVYLRIKNVIKHLSLLMEEIRDVLKRSGLKERTFQDLPKQIALYCNFLREEIISTREMVKKALNDAFVALANKYQIQIYPTRQNAVQ